MGEVIILGELDNFMAPLELCLTCSLLQTSEPPKSYENFVAYVVYRVFPDWKVHSSFISDALASALALDAKLSSHPIEVDCPDANMINQASRSISAGNFIQLISFNQRRSSTTCRMQRPLQVCRI